jgi:hypothetical protein
MRQLSSGMHFASLAAGSSAIVKAILPQNTPAGHKRASAQGKGHQAAETAEQKIYQGRFQVACRCWQWH